MVHFFTIINLHTELNKLNVSTKNDVRLISLANHKVVYKKCIKALFMIGGVLHRGDFPTLYARQAYMSTLLYIL